MRRSVGTRGDGEREMYFRNSAGTHYHVMEGCCGARTPYVWNHKGNSLVPCAICCKEPEDRSMALITARNGRFKAFSAHRDAMTHLAVDGIAPSPRTLPNDVGRIESGIRDYLATRDATFSEAFVTQWVNELLHWTYDDYPAWKRRHDDVREDIRMRLGQELGEDVPDRIIEGRVNKELYRLYFAENPFPNQPLHKRVEAQGRVMPGDEREWPGYAESKAAWDADTLDRWRTACRKWSVDMDPDAMSRFVESAHAQYDSYCGNIRHWVKGYQQVFKMVEHGDPVAHDGREWLSVNWDDLVAERRRRNMPPVRALASDGSIHLFMRAEEDVAVNVRDQAADDGLMFVTVGGWIDMTDETAPHFLAPSQFNDGYVRIWALVDTKADLATAFGGEHGTESMD